MSRIAVDPEPEPESTPAQPRRFWRKLAQALDQYFADRTRRAVPEITLRRSKHEVARCRRLMLKNAMAPAEAPVSGVSRRHVAQPRSR